MKNKIDNLILNLSNTLFEFGIDKYNATYDYSNLNQNVKNDLDDIWPKIYIKVKNNHFNYETNDELMTVQEIHNLYDDLVRLLNGKVKNEEKITTYEDILGFVLYPEKYLDFIINVDNSLQSYTIQLVGDNLIKFKDYIENIIN